MRRKSLAIFGLAALCLLLGGPGCVLEEKVIEVILTGETCVEFPEDHESETFITPVTIDYAQRVDGILEGEGLGRSDIAMARVVSASYQVTSFDHDHDWTISGYISVERVGGGDPDTILSYVEQSLLEAMPEAVSAPLESGGVAIVNQALEDYLKGDYPMLRFEVYNGSVGPPPGPSDRLVFDWEACIEVHILYQEDLEVPDPL